MRLCTCLITFPISLSFFNIVLCTVLFSSFIYPETPPHPPTTLKDSLRGRRLSLEQLGGSGECSSAEVFPPSRQDESIAEEEGEERTREEEEVEVERQSREMDEEEEGEGKWQREESGCDTETKSGAETQNARDEVTEDRKTPDTSDEIMERYVEYAGEEEERSERGRREEGETERDVQHEVVEETDGDGVREEEEGAESCRRSSEEQRSDRRTEAERKTSSKPPEEDLGNDEEPKVMKMSESEEEEIERLEGTKGNAGMLLQQKGRAGEKKKLLLRCDRLPSEVRNATFDPSCSLDACELECCSRGPDLPYQSVHPSNLSIHLSVWPAIRYVFPVCVCVCMCLSCLLLLCVLYQN